MEQGLKQVAALPYRLREELENCLITSRRTSRPIIPKGWPVRGLSDGQAAARESYEEAGLKGRIDELPIGGYTYWKRRPSHSDLIEVIVFPMKVRRRRRNWPEKGQRCSAWIPAEAAAALVDDAGLAALIRAFAARFARAGGDPFGVRPSRVPDVARLAASRPALQPVMPLKRLGAPPGPRGRSTARASCPA